MKSCKFLRFLLIYVCYALSLPLHTSVEEVECSPPITIRPFRAYRPRNNLVTHIACLPYNLINTQEARLLSKYNKFSFLHICRPEVNLDEQAATYDEVAGLKGREMLNKFIRHNWLVQDPQPSLYVYAHENEHGRQVGIITTIALQNYHDNRIKRHELVFPQKRIALTAFIEQQNAHIDPALLIYQASSEIEQLIESVTQQKPRQKFISEDGCKHALWLVSDPLMLDLIQYHFSLVPTLYIADGHHRFSAAYHMQKKHDKELLETRSIISDDDPFNYILTAIFPTNQIQICAYHRIIKNLNGLSEQEFFAKVQEKFDVYEVENLHKAKPKQPHNFGMFLANKWYSVTIKQQNLDERKDDPVKNLDLTLLTELLLKPILGVGRRISYADDNIQFVGGNDALEKLETKCKKGEGKVAFALYPVTAEDFMKVVNAERLMPPKTTWFEPKIRPGLFVRTLDKN